MGLSESHRAWSCQISTAGDRASHIHIFSMMRKVKTKCCYFNLYIDFQLKFTSYVSRNTVFSWSSLFLAFLDAIVYELVRFDDQPIRRPVEWVTNGVCYCFDWKLCQVEYQMVLILSNIPPVCWKYKVDLDDPDCVYWISACDDFFWWPNSDCSWGWNNIGCFHYDNRSTSWQRN